MAIPPNKHIKISNILTISSHAGRYSISSIVINMGLNTYCAPILFIMRMPLIKNAKESMNNTYPNTIGLNFILISPTSNKNELL